MYVSFHIFPDTKPKSNPLLLANALAACCLSSRLASDHRQWAAQQLVKALAGKAKDETGSRGPQSLPMVADVQGELPQCPVEKVEAHTAPLTASRWNTKKALLATWSVYLAPYSTIKFLTYMYCEICL